MEINFVRRLAFTNFARTNVADIAFNIGSGFRCDVGTRQ